MNCCCFYQKRRFDRSRYYIVPRCLDELLPFRRKNASTALSSTLKNVFKSWVGDAECGVRRFCYCKLCRLYVLCRHCKLSSGNVYFFFFFFLSAGSCRGKRWSLLLNSFPSVLETGLEIPNPKGRRLPPFFFIIIIVHLL